ncbi:MAG: tail fiber domain-containing protein [Candidatus Nanoarchaeia archaeon]|nr:tail fiber domain-containing protein [Candidatus Nanoarchaeia archaeon]MDD5357987.1 tail fiber domain-containing protein [Candidatus Nanoarchaeia archaeon]MDD5588906.1 tail fiber domain-containing protein [Candidatus Nanoarchaeia archaeon]
MKKKRGLNININFSNRWLYTFIFLGILTIITVGVYAYSNPTTGVGHDLNEIQPCSEDQILKTTGGAWSCSASPVSSQWITNKSGNIYFNGNVSIAQYPSFGYAKLYVGTYGGQNNPGIYSFGSPAITGYGTYSAGYVFYAAGAGTKYGQESSIRWKENITEIPNALDKILKLQGVYFNWKNSGEHGMGFIAEEVGKIVPEVVGYDDAKNKSNWYFDSKGNKQLYATGVDYGSLTPVLVEAIKEQQKQIDSLKSELCKKDNSYSWCK